RPGRTWFYLETKAASMAEGVRRPAGTGAPGQRRRGALASSLARCAQAREDSMGTNNGAAGPALGAIDDARPMPVSAAALATLLCCRGGLAQVAVKLANEGISPIFHAGLRSIGATVLLLAWIGLRGIPVFRRDGTLPAGIAAGALFGAE